MLKDARKTFVAALINSLVSLLAELVWTVLSAKINTQLKARYFNRLLQLDCAWFDTHQPEVLSSRFSQDFQEHLNAIGNSSHTIIYSISRVLGSLIIGFINGWKYTGLLLLSIPFLFLGLAGYAKAVASQAKKVKPSYDKAGAISSEILADISTVQSLNGEEHELRRYTEQLKIIRSVNSKQNVITSFFFGVMNSSFILEYAYGWLIATIFMKNQYNNDNFGRDYSMRDVFLIFFAVVNGCMSVASVGPSLEAI